jgi:hypothetical protein
MGLAEVGEAKPAWIGMLTTEHFNLQTQRASTVSEANGRASVFLGAVSAGLIALGFQGVGQSESTGTVTFQVLVLTSLLFLGLVAFARCLEVSVDDWEFANRIARLRLAYGELAPELVRVFEVITGDDQLSLMLGGRWRPLQKMLSVAGSIAVLTSVIFGSDIGLVIYGFGHSLSAALITGAVTGAVLVVLTSIYQWRRLCRASVTPAIGPGQLPVPRTPTRPMGLSEIGDPKPAWIGMLTTEHFNMQTQRASTVTEANGRATVFLGAVSAGLIALGFQGIGHGQSTGTMIFEVLVLTSLLFLGLVAFARCLEVSVDDWEFANRIARLRLAYAELAPELGPVFDVITGEEQFSTMLAGRWRPLQKMLSVAGSMAVLTSLIFGCDVGVVTYGITHSLSTALIAGVVAGAVLIVLTVVYQQRRWCRASFSPPIAQQQAD